MFVPRIWFDEVERIGKQRCTPVGYVLQQIGDLTGVAGLLSFLGVPAYLAYRGFMGTFDWPLLWLSMVPVALGIAGAIIVSYSWALATRKGFNYDYQRRESSWIEAGEKRTYTFEDWQATREQRGS
jgi:hypothetical protein